MKPLQELTRPNIWALKPYSSARDEYSGKTASVFLDANENPYNAPNNRYPDPLQKELKALIAPVKKVKPEQIFLGNGSDEAIALLYRAFGWADTMPEFAHLPLLLKPDGKGKLSKRDGDRLGFPVFPLEWHDPKTGEVSSGYRESGYLPEAVLNFLALLGWNPGNDQEMMTLDEMVQLFDIRRCSKAGARFDYVKGIWFNHEYILKMSDEKVAEQFMPILRELGSDAPMDKVVTIVGMMKGRVNFVKELWETCKFFFVAPTEYDPKTVQKRWKEDSAEMMTRLADLLESLDDFSLEHQEQVVMKWIEDNGYHTGNIMNAFRLTLVGEGKGPHMFDISSVLGKEETIARMRRAIEVLK